MANLSPQIASPAPAPVNGEIERIQRKLIAVRRALARNDDSFEFWADQALALTSIGEAVEGIIRTLRRTKRSGDLEEVAGAFAARRNAEEALHLIALIETACDQPCIFADTSAAQAFPQVLALAIS